MNERIKELRKHFNLTQKEFGDRIGLGYTAISKLELGVNSPAEITLRSICREFDVDYIWLTTGTGFMIDDDSEVFLDEVADRYGLSDDDKDLVRAFSSLSQSDRDAITALMKAFIKKK